MRSRNVCVGAFVSACFILFVVIGHSANAITLNSGDVAIYNFNFTGQTPAPPYGAVTATVNFANVTAGSISTFDFFSELNGNGILSDHFASIGIPTASAGFSVFAPDLVDGILSLRITVGAGPFDIVSTVAEGKLGPGNPVATVTGSLAATPLLPHSHSSPPA